MLKTLKLTNVGPAPSMELAFGERMNLITGDNGLGKSFLLDIAWWAMTGTWPAEVNPRLTSGRLALPNDKKQDAVIDLEVLAVSGDKAGSRTFDRDSQNWQRSKGRPVKSGLVIYAMSDGSFAVWDPERNYWRDKDNPAGRQDAYVFAPKEVWDGLQSADGNWLCNGLIRDWAGWQKENGRAFENLQAVLRQLSPSRDEQLVPGPLTRISLTDARDMPTIKMPYGMDVPILHVSAGMRRVIALAYFLVWCWEEHLKAVELKGLEPETRITFLIDEVEAHLHPRWQRSVIPSLLDVMQTLATDARVQLLTVTHSPLVMASVEPKFDSAQDTWFDLDLEQGEVKLRQRPFVRHGDASRWLISEAFDLGSARSLEAEETLEQAAKILSEEVIDEQLAKRLDAKLRTLLGDTDPFWIRWRYVGEKQGWLQ